MILGRVTINPLAGRRARAYAMDGVGYLGVAAALLPLGVVLHRTAPPTPAQTLLLSAIPPVAATLWAAVAESGPRQATWGKRRYGLAVVPRPLSFGQAVLRNTVKIAVPWQIGHVVAIGAASGGLDRADPLTIGATVAIYPLMGALAWTSLLGPGRGLHDRLAGTSVCTTSGRVAPASVGGTADHGEHR